MPNHEYTVELRIYSWTLDRSEITKEIGISSVPVPDQPRWVGKSGPRVWATKGVEPSEENPDPWVSWDSLEEGLTFVLNKLWPHRDAIARYKMSGEIVWWCGHFQSSFDGGPELSSAMLKKLGEFGADLCIDNYFSPPGLEER